MSRLAHLAHLTRHLRVRPRLTIALAVGVVFAVASPAALGGVARGLIGWNVAVWLYLVLIATMMLRADHGTLRRTAVAHAEAASTVLAIVSVACVVSLLGSVMQLSAAKLPGASHALPHVAMAVITVVGSWLLLPMVFSLTYASLYYRSTHGHGLQFPGADEASFKPDYTDFMYFAFTIAVASQTADVSVSSQAMRRLVLVQSLLSFAFNTAILALTINIAASMF